MDKSSIKNSKDDQKPPAGLCGVWGWTPKWLQRFNNMTVFIVCYVALAVIYGMSNSYTSSMIPSIEKRFGFTSKSTGIILATNDVAHVLVALVTAHFGGNGHRPRWISLGSFMLGVSLLFHASPEIFFPMKVSPTSFSSSPASGRSDLLCSEARGRQLNDSTVTENCGQPDNPIGPLVVLGIAHFFLGVGSTTLLILGLPFIDDNTDKKNRPVFFAISFSGRIFGPALGYLLGALCNTVFVDWSDPGFPQTDPRWISAWYLGYLITGMGLCVFALTMGCFPSSVPRRGKTSTKNSAPSIKEKEANPQPVEKKVSWQDLPCNLRELLTNGAYMARVFSIALEGLLIAGYLSFLPKFIGLQFQISPSGASVAGGVPSVLAVALGVLTGGFLIRKFNPEPRHIGLVLTASALIMSATFFGVIGLGCEQTAIYGFGSMEQGQAERAQLSLRNSTCPSARACGCPDTNFQPVCNPATGVNYYSACHAGCQSFVRVNETTKHYRQCSCVENSFTKANISLPADQLDFTISSVPASLVGGLCPKKCPNLYIFVVLLFLAYFTVGLPLSGSIMIMYRIVRPDLKSLGTGVYILLMSGLGLLPGPILAGALVDSTCRLWQVKSCGERGFCLLYDTDDLRWKLHVAVGTIKFAAALLDMLVTYKVWGLEFERDEVPATGHSRPPSPPPVLAALDTYTQDSVIAPTFEDRRLSTMLSDDHYTSKV